MQTNHPLHIRLEAGRTHTWLALPANREEYRNALERLAVSDAAACTITRARTVINGVPAHLLTGAKINKVNYLAARLSVLTPEELASLNAISLQLNSLDQLIAFAHRPVPGQLPEPDTAISVPEPYQLEPFNPLAAAEQSMEANGNMVDGIINNLPAPKADLTDGQSHAEIVELAPETLPGQKPSILEYLRRAKENGHQQGPPLHSER